MLAAAVFLHEAVTPMGLLGMALVIGGMLLSSGVTEE